MNSQKLLSLVRTFDALKHGQAPVQAALNKAESRGVEHRAALAQKNVEALTGTFRDLSAALEESPDGTEDVSALADAVRAAQKRVQNWRNNAEWKGAQFGSELLNYAREGGLGKDNTRDVDVTLLEACAAGFAALRERCESKNQRFTYQKAIDSIDALLAEDAEESPPAE